MITPEALRQVLIDALLHIAHPELARQYQRRVPIADVASELVCHWDDEYHMADPVLPKAFTAPELSALAEFHAAFESVCGSIEPWPALEPLLEHPGWQWLSVQAQRVLAVLGVDAQQGVPADAAAPRG